MILNEKMAKVIGELEACVGEHCYNGNSYDGWRQIEGCGFRYPVKVPVRKKDGETEFVKVRLNLRKTYLLDEEDITPNAIENMHYCFGSNKMYIGKGILVLMKALEQRYGLDFNQLEDNLLQAGE